MLSLRPTTGATRAARHQVVAWAREAGLRPDGEHVLALLTSELVANAVRHAEGEVTVGARTDGRSVVVEVCDGSTVRPVLLRQSPSALGGRGVDIIDRLAEAWGVRARTGGKVVWFAVPL